MSQENNDLSDEEKSLKNKRTLTWILDDKNWKILKKKIFEFIDDDQDQ